MDKPIHTQVCILVLLKPLLTSQYPTPQTPYHEDLCGEHLCHHTERFCRAGGKGPAVDAADLCPGLAFKAGTAAFPIWCMMPLSFPRTSMEFVDVAGDER